LLDLSEQLGGLQIVPSSTSDPIARTPAKEKRHYKPPATAMALDTFFNNKIESMKLEIIQGQAVLRRLEAQRNEYNSRVRLLREELGLLQQPGSYVGEVVKVMGTKKVLVKVHPEGKYGMKVHRALITN
jgi:ATP-dependent 26S proteasome regulatory subunit